jgi:hypothetical protein
MAPPASRAANATVVTQKPGQDSGWQAGAELTTPRPTLAYGLLIESGRVTPENRTGSGAPRCYDDRMASHKFKLGDLVELTGAMRLNAPREPFEIVRLLPCSDDDPEYRIKGPNEEHERAAKESELRHPRE